MHNFWRLPLPQKADTLLLKKKKPVGHIGRHHRAWQIARAAKRKSSTKRPLGFQLQLAKHKRLSAVRKHDVIANTFKRNNRCSNWKRWLPDAFLRAALQPGSVPNRVVARQFQASHLHIGHCRMALADVLHTMQSEALTNLLRRFGARHLGSETGGSPVPQLLAQRVPRGKFRRNIVTQLRQLNLATQRVQEWSCNLRKPKTPS